MNYINININNNLQYRQSLRQSKVQLNLIMIENKPALMNYICRSDYIEDY